MIGLFPGIDQLRSRLPIERRSAHSSSVQQLRQFLVAPLIERERDLYNDCVHMHDMWITWDLQYIAGFESEKPF